MTLYQIIGKESNNYLVKGRTSASTNFNEKVLIRTSDREDLCVFLMSLTLATTVSCFFVNSEILHFVAYYMHM